MADDQEIMVQDLIERVHKLMGMYKDAKDELNELSIQNEDISRQLSEQNIKLENLEQQYKTAKIATNFLAPIEDKEEARGQLNRIVREIDNCIALLNR